LIEMGHVAGSYGLRGWVKVAPGGGASQGLADAKEWWIGDKAYKVVAKGHGSTVVAQISGIHTREEALALKGSKVSVRREALAEPGEGHYYHADLLGLEVVNGRGEVLGVVKRLFTNGAQDVMEVAGETAGKSRLLPWVPAVVKEVDLAEKRIVVEWEADW
jgi:16S rRNA processing protein RimM